MITFKKNKLTGKEKAAITLSRISISLYTTDEVNKLILAFRDKYNISSCDELPYSPKSINVILKGKIL